MARRRRGRGRIGGRIVLDSKTIKVGKILPHTAQDVWAALRDFASPWHPLVARMDAEAGGIRAFTVTGEDTLYRERLTWFSDTQRLYRYTHIEGIEGAERYDGSLSVQPHGNGCRVEMQAEVAARPGRLEAIAFGTRQIFELGLDALAQDCPAPVPRVDVAHPSTDRREIRVGNLALTQMGDGSGPLVLFLHGIGGNRSNWDAQLPVAARFGTAAALDLRGYGGSELPLDQVTLDDYLSDIEAVQAYFGADRMVLCGLSYGAWIATAFAERHPDRLAGLILSGGCTGMSEAPPDVRAGFRAAREAPLDRGQTPADFAEDVIAAIAGPQCPDHARAALLASMSAIPTSTYRQSVRCFTTPPGPFDFSRLTLPVLMMTGEYDRLAPPDEILSVAQRIHQHAPSGSVRYEVIEAAGHVCNLEAPEAYNSVLAEVLKGIVR